METAAQEEVNFQSSGKGAVDPQREALLCLVIDDRVGE